MPAVIFTDSVSLRLGEESLSLPQRVESQIGASQSSPWAWEGPTAPVNAPAIPVSPPYPPQAVITAPWIRAPHVALPANDTGVNPNPGTLPEVLKAPIPAGPPGSTPTSPTPPAGANSRATLNGGGSLSRVIKASGTLKIRPFLAASGNGRMEVFLSDPGGAEKKFSGKSLLEWIRNNDTTNSPLYFKGSKKSESMFLQNPPNDWSAKSGLEYSIDVTQGQTVRLKTSGSGIGSSRLEIQGPI